MFFLRFNECYQGSPKANCRGETEEWENYLCVHFERSEKSLIQHLFETLPSLCSVRVTGVRIVFTPPPQAVPLLSPEEDYILYFKVFEKIRELFQ